MNKEEVQARVDKALASFNPPGQRPSYDYRETHYNTVAKQELDLALVAYSEGKISEESLKGSIRTFRDYSRVSLIDFCIPASEPSVEDFERLCILFDRGDLEQKVTPDYGPEERLAAFRDRVTRVLALTMGCSQHISDKLRQQFTNVLIKATERTPDILAASLNLENYNPYKKIMSQEPVVKFFSSAPGPTQELSLPPSEEVDNSAFEARLPTTPAKTVRATKKKSKEGFAGALENLERVIEKDPGVTKRINSVTLRFAEIETHKEFAAYCNKLYEKSKGNQI